jgi:hypothetical protein
VTGDEDNLPRFTHRVHTDVSKAIHTLLANERYDAPRQVFDGRKPHMMRLVDPAAQASHLVYEYLNSCAAGLIERPEDMPGVVIEWGMWKSGGIDVVKPPIYFGDDRPDVLRLELTPPPELYRQFGGDMDALVHHMRQLSEHGLKAIQRARSRPVLGAAAVKKIHPWSEPKTLRESGGERVPTFKIGARGIVGRRIHVACASETHAFRRSNRSALEARCCDGDMEAVFPYGTYQMRVLHRVPVEERPPAGAILAMPGATLSEVKAELARERDAAALRVEAHAMIDEVRAAFEEEADQIVEHDDLELIAPPARSVGASSGESESEEATASEPASDDHASAEPAATTELPVVECHRFDERPEVGTARRLSILRDRRGDRRRGKRRRPGRHGSDPPE